MRVTTTFDERGYNINLGFSNIDEINNFIQSSMQNPANQMGYVIKVEKLPDRKKMENAGII